MRLPDRRPRGRLAPETRAGHTDRRRLPNDVSRVPRRERSHATTAGVTGFGEEDAGRAERLAAAVRRLDEWDVDCIVAVGGSVATLAGPDVERSFGGVMRAAVDVPFTASLGSRVDAPNAPGAESLLIVTPIPPERDAQTRGRLSKGEGSTSS